MLTTTNTLLLAGLADPENDAIWREFHERYQPILVAFARRFGLTDDQAQDATQEALLRFVQEYRAGRYERSRGRLRSWIFAIARARILDQRRKRGRSDAWRGDSALANTPADDELEAAWEEEWRRAILRQGILELRTGTNTDPKTIRTFELLALEERTPQEVAELVGSTVNAVYVAKHRALDRLRAILTRLAEEF